MTELDYIRIVLLQPTHPGNIGATARAMANMGVARLVLVQPQEFPSLQATARAAGAEHILQNATVVAELDQAIADCALVIGTSARPRSIAWPLLQPAAAMQTALETARQSEVALLFGRESRGLSNHELERCHCLVRIAVDAAFPSMNLAAAVMVLLYELRKAAENAARDEAHTAQNQSPAPDAEPTEPRAVAADMQHFYRHLQRLLTSLQFGNGSNTKLQRKLTRLFNRAQPYAQEIRMLRGLLTAIEEKIQRESG